MPVRSSRTTVLLSAALIASSVAIVPCAFAADIAKDNNSTSMNNASSWVGGISPVAADNVLFNNTISSALTVNQGASSGTNLSWGSIVVSNLGGAVTVNQNGSSNTLTLNTGGINMSAATADLTFNSGFVRLASANFGGTFDVVSGRTLTLNSLNNQGNTKTATFQGAGSVILNGNSGSGGVFSFNVNGAAVTMNGASNAWSSGTVTSGSLTVGNSAALSTFSTAVNAANGLRFANGITSATLRNLSGTGDFALTNAGSQAVALTTTGDTASSFTYSGAISGAGSLIKNGTSTVTLSGNNSFSGGLTVNGGIVNFGNSNAAGGSTATITAASTTTLSLTNSSSVFLAGGITLSGTNADVKLTSANASAGFSTAFTGSSDQILTIGGTTQVNLSASTQQLSSMVGTVAVASGATLRMSASNLNNGGTNTTFDLTGSLTSRNNGFLTLGALKGTGNISMGTNGPNDTNLTLTIGGKGLSTSYSGVISDGDASLGKRVAVTKTGIGNQTFTAAQNFTGATLVSNGTLTLANTASITNTASVTVNSGATFANNGSISSVGAITVNGTIQGTGSITGASVINGNLTPGNSEGKLTFAGNLTLGDGALGGTGALSTFELGTNAGAGLAARGVLNGYDAVDITNSGTLTYDGSLIVAFGANTYADGSNFKLFDFSGVPGNNFDSVTLAGTSYGGLGALVYNSLAGTWSNTFGTTLFTYANATGILSLSASAVPEPLTAGCVFLLAGRALGRRSRVSL